MIDIGVNLTNRAFEGDRAAVLDRARAVGVEAMVVTGTDLDESRKAMELCADDPAYLYSTAGVHPHDAKDCDGETIETLRTLLAEDCVKAVGECGLDFNRNYSPPAVQREWFEKQVILACEVQMPLFVHEREAAQDLLEILDRHAGTGGDGLPPVVVHCFTAGKAELCAYLERGFHIGITGWICDERRGQELQEIVPRIPLDRLMIETDSPFLLPRSLRPKPRGRRNEPAYLVEIRNTLADLLDISADELAEATIRTSRAFFAI